MVRGISMALPTYTDPIHTALTEKMRRDKQVYIIGEDVAMRSVFRTAA
jgi:pyruvate/2-oxoglutarate/acetoin dehydrogenase E1 component